MGGNTRRQSHNPPAVSQLDILDRTGTLTWDENRDYVFDGARYMTQLVRRDRNHASVIVWSSCNEGECRNDPQDGNKTTLDYFGRVHHEDPSRPTSANLNPQSSAAFQDLVDVMGYSHRSAKDFVAYH